MHEAHGVEVRCADVEVVGVAAAPPVLVGARVRDVTVQHLPGRRVRHVVCTCTACMWHPDGPRAHARCARATSAAVGFTQHFTNLAADEPGINENSHHISRLQLAADGESIEA